MVFNFKKFGGRKGKKKVYDVDRDGRKLKVIVYLGENGEVMQVMEKPDFKATNKKAYLSGAHIISMSPEQNHVDSYKDGIKVGVEKTPDRTFQYGEDGAFWKTPESSD
ncbi:hypothetical protein AUJ64_02770 [Candidatus Pacearchaeota archaeon CG1_02_39_14]|nr:MAG: hypothetical protein AUJ64_02770 [Candidatus Pacearchaeota archaeon CG1_02_39_14]